MDERVASLKTPKECENFANNVANRLPDLALNVFLRGSTAKVFVLPALGR